MGILLLLPLLFSSTLIPQTSSTTSNSSRVVVINFKWFPTHQTVNKQDLPSTAPAPEMTAGNKNAGRVARVNNPLIPDPNEQTVDGRSAAIEKIVQEARTTTPRPQDGFTYQARIQNASAKPIEIVFWEYQFIDPANQGTTTRRQFLCGVNIKPDKEKDLQVFSLLGPSDSVNAATLANRPDNPFQEKAVINRIEFADGSIWQRKDWNFAEIRESYHRAIATPWDPGTCRSL